MGKEKEFKKICENWEGWINEQAPRRAGDYVDPDDQRSGYMRTKKGVEKIASIPRPDDEQVKTTSDQDAPGEKELIKKQKKRGMRAHDPDTYENFSDALVDTLVDRAEDWNGSFASAFFKFPGQKGAEGYTWGNFAADMLVLGMSFLPATHALGFIARGGQNVAKAFKASAAGGALSSKAGGFLLMMAARHPGKVGKAIEVSGQGLAKIAAEKIPYAMWSKAANETANAINSGKKTVIPVDKVAMKAVIKAAKAKGSLAKLKADKGFMAAYTALKGA